MLRFVIDSARAAGIEVGLCGEMAADPRFALLLVGLGLRRLSMSPRRIPEVKTLAPRVVRVGSGRARHSAAWSYSTAAEVRAPPEPLLRVLPAAAGERVRRVEIDF